jgi:hypothetical protein
MPQRLIWMKEGNMRIWTIHPGYLDAKGLTAAWREGLLAQKILEGKTTGYVNHPQLARFKVAENGNRLISKYLVDLLEESMNRNYNFDESKIGHFGLGKNETIKVSRKQIEYEFELLKWKLEKRDKWKYNSIKDIDFPRVNSIFEIIDGDIENWEKTIPEVIKRVNCRVINLPHI